eukprot:Gb_25537 [translate_table: standard]
MFLFEVSGRLNLKYLAFHILRVFLKTKNQIVWAALSSGNKSWASDQKSCYVAGMVGTIGNSLMDNQRTAVAPSVGNASRHAPHCHACADKSKVTQFPSPVIQMNWSHQEVGLLGFGLILELGSIWYYLNTTSDSLTRSSNT